MIKKIKITCCLILCLLLLSMRRVIILNRAMISGSLSEKIFNIKFRNSILYRRIITRIEISILKYQIINNLLSKRKFNFEKKTKVWILSLKACFWWLLNPGFYPEKKILGISTLTSMQEISKCLDSYVGMCNLTTVYEITTSGIKNSSRGQHEPGVRNKLTFEEF